MPEPELTAEQRKELEDRIKNMSPEELQEFQKQQCIFCQLISGKIPSKKIYEDDKVIAILDINPAEKGHLLLMPKEHYAIMPQIPEKEISHLFKVSKLLSQSLLRSLKVAGTSIFIANGLAAGQRAQHFMIHVIPRSEGDNLLPLNEKIIDNDMLQKVKVAIENKLNELLGVKKKVVSVEETNSEESGEIYEDQEDEGDEDEEVPVSIADIPEKVVKALQKALPGSEIEEAELETEDGQRVYELTVSHENKTFEVEITPQGKVVKIEQEDDEGESDEEIDSPEESDQEESEKEKGGRDVDLDDIANLFK